MKALVLLWLEECKTYQVIFIPRLVSKIMGTPDTIFKEKIGIIYAYSLVPKRIADINFKLDTCSSCGLLVRKWDLGSLKS